MNPTMLRQVSSRNYRSKGLKVKKALQLFLLLALTIWFGYQVKHSYDKKKSYDEIKNNKPVSISSLKEELNEKTQEEIIKLGRKDLPQIDEKNRVKISERDTKVDENYEDEETITEEREEIEELEKDEMGADSEESTLLEDEESGKDEISEARERSFHGDNVASAVTHDVNLTWHDDYLENIRNNKNNNNNNNNNNKTNLVIENEIKNETSLVNELREKTTTINLTNGIVVTYNETISGATNSGLKNVEETEKNNLNIVSDDNSDNESMNITIDSSGPIEIGDDKINDSHIEIMGVNGGGDIVLE